MSGSDQWQVPRGSFRRIGTVGRQGTLKPICPDCGRAVSRLKDGALRTHGNPRCDGSGRIL